ncbi:hypothetical protein M422DRAFT_250512 [Sphaerobolus stellatus SS14]|uniref:F-box domain-containing protein n=1 Tax=Sphaerobolus stellatus (strain SS14) TaxID=990650 RepID=A0A0C9VTY4_SPHS4|nr:hypothetical protein M422DRAFT_250512 [Sphaerobolus stellatus SS14]
MQQIPTLPPDIWLKIMVDLESQWGLFVLSTTCKELRCPALPKAYRTVVLKAPDYPDSAGIVYLSGNSTDSDMLAETLEEIHVVMDREIAYSQAIYQTELEKDDQNLLWETLEELECAFEDVLQFAGGLSLQSLLLHGCMVTPGFLELISGVNILKIINIPNNKSPFKLWKDVIQYPPADHVTELRLSSTSFRPEAVERDSAKTQLLLLLYSSLKIVKVSLHAISNIDKECFRLATSSSSRVCSYWTILAIRRTMLMAPSVFLKSA